MSSVWAHIIIRRGQTLARVLRRFTAGRQISNSVSLLVPDGTQNMTSWPRASELCQQLVVQRFESFLKLLLT